MKRILIFLIILLFPYRVFAEELIPNAKSGILIEANSGKIIFEKNMNDRVSIASMTKMVAQIIIFEEIEKKNIKLDDIVTVSKNASDMGGSQIYLEQGEKMTVSDLLKGISVASANDATVAMAEYISGTEQKFVERMNSVVKKLGLKNTHFVNCTGLDEENHYSSSYDMAMIARELVVNHKEILKYSSIYEDYLRADTDNKFWLVNTNKLINQYEGADGLKTGHTDNALYCLAATAKRNNLRLIAIVLGEKDSRVRNNETIGLLDYGFNNIKYKVVKKKGALMKTIPMNNANINRLGLILKNDILILDDEDLKYKYDISINKIKTPLKKGSVIGSVDIISNGIVLSSTELISDSDIFKLSFFEIFKRNLYNFFIGDI